MNYLASLVLIGTGFDEYISFAIIDSLMSGKKHGLSGLYEPNLRSLYEMSDHVYSWLLLDKNSDLERLITVHKLPLTTLLAGPFMTMFANMLDTDTCLQVMDRVVLAGKSALLDVVKNVFKTMQTQMFSKGDELHPYLIK